MLVQHTECAMKCVQGVCSRDVCARVGCVCVAVTAKAVVKKGYVCQERVGMSSSRGV